MEIGSRDRLQRLPVEMVVWFLMVAVLLASVAEIWLPTGDEIKALLV